MGMSLGSPKAKGVTPHLNVTPLVDVVLVLLIIFMVVLPMLTKQMWAHLPKQEPTDVPSESRAIVLRVADDGTLSINGTPFAETELDAHLPRMLRARPDKIVFLDAAKRAPYRRAVLAIDAAKRAGARDVAILTEGLAP